MTNEEVELQARLASIEYLLRHVLTALFLGYPEPKRALAEMRANISAGIATLTFPIPEPTLSDHIAAEIETAVERLLSDVASNLESVSRRAEPPG